VQETKLKTWQHGFTQPCVFDIHVPKRLTCCHFFNDPISTSDDEKFQEPFFHLACGRHVSLRHVVAIDPLIDSIPESSIDGWASAVLHLTGAKKLEVVPTTINLLGSCNFRLSSHSHLPSPFTTHVDHRLHNQLLLAVFSGDPPTQRSFASAQERYINVAPCKNVTST